MSTTTTDPAPSQPAIWYEHQAVKSVLSCPQRCCACCGNSCTKFKAFIAKGSVVDLAIAVIIGNAFQKIVSTFTDGIVTPLIAAATFNDGNATQQLVRLCPSVALYVFPSRLYLFHQHIYILLLFLSKISASVSLYMIHLHAKHASHRAHSTLTSTANQSVSVISSLRYWLSSS